MAYHHTMTFPLLCSLKTYQQHACRGIRGVHGPWRGSRIRRGSLTKPQHVGIAISTHVQIGILSSSSTLPKDQAHPFTKCWSEWMWTWIFMNFLIHEWPKQGAKWSEWTWSEWIFTYSWTLFMNNEANGWACLKEGVHRWYADYYMYTHREETVRTSSHTLRVQSGACCILK